jgi:hypothetical protein
MGKYGGVDDNQIGGMHSNFQPDATLADNGSTILIKNEYFFWV